MLTWELWFTTGDTLGLDKLWGLNLGNRSAYFPIFSCLAQRLYPGMTLQGPTPDPSVSQVQPCLAGAGHRHSTAPRCALLQGALQAPEPPQLSAPLSPRLLLTKAQASREVCAHPGLAGTLHRDTAQGHTAAPDSSTQPLASSILLQLPSPQPLAPPVSLGTETCPLVIHSLNSSHLLPLLSDREQHRGSKSHLLCLHPVVWAMWPCTDHADQWEGEFTGLEVEQDSRNAH